MGSDRTCRTHVPGESNFNPNEPPVIVNTSDSDSAADHSLLPVVLLAYKERHPDERRLWAMANAIGLQLHEVSRVPGASGNPVEIYEGKFITPGNEAVVLEV